MNLSFCVFALFLAGVFANNRQTAGRLEDFRADFHLADTEEEIDDLLARPVTESDGAKLLTVKAYKAVLQSMKAEYAFLPTTKYKHFKEGKTDLEAVIAQEKNLETVYLRLMLQLNLPKFLGYHKNIKTDLVFFQENVKKSEIPMRDRRMFIESLLKIKNSDHDLTFLQTTELK